jgi:ribosomal protein S21
MILVVNGDIQTALRKFKKQSAEILSDARQHEYAMTKMQKRRRKSARARKRALKELRK